MYIVGSTSFISSCKVDFFVTTNNKWDGDGDARRIDDMAKTRNFDVNF
ncbi:hypothetical protein PP707_07805 [Acetobacter pasteurianus]|nr:hypothetical protein [Acetobacter pasteurianus]